MNPQAKPPETDLNAWQPGWPTAQIGTLRVVRALALPGPDAPPEDNSSQWHLTLSRISEDHFGIIGEINRFVQQFFVSVAAEATIRLRSDQNLLEDTSDEARDALLLTYGPWVSHALWDYTRPFLLQATSGLIIQSPVSVPVKTPRPTLRTTALINEQSVEHRDNVQESNSADEGREDTL